MTTTPSERQALPPLTNLGDVLSPRPGQEFSTAVLDTRNGEPLSYTYLELDRLAGGVAAHLAERGFARGSRVGILAANRAEYLATYFGIMRAGLVAVPLNFRLGQATLDFIFADAELVLAFVDDEQQHVVPSGYELINFDGQGTDGFASVIEPTDFRGVDVNSAAIAEMLYTSGSSGVPKGVPLSHAGQLWALRALAGAVDGGPEVTIVAQPLFHMNGVVVTSMALLSGDVIVLQPRFSTAQYVDAIRRFGVTRVSAVPTMWSRALSELEAGRADLSSVRSVSLGSAPTTPELIARTRQMVPGVAVSLSYGTTEAGPAIFGPDPSGTPTPDGSLGYLIDGVEIQLVDGPSPDEGVLVSRTPAVMEGYHQLPERSASVLQDGWYYSGDVVHRDAEGFFYFIGRADDMFVCGGENIYPGEVERILESHPGIHQAVVVPLHDAERGEIPVAFIVPGSQGTSLTSDEVKAHVIANAAPHLHPRRVSFRAELPLAGTNKTDRNHLLALARELETTASWS